MASAIDRIRAAVDQAQEEFMNTTAKLRALEAERDALKASIAKLSAPELKANTITEFWTFVQQNLTTCGNLDHLIRAWVNGDNVDAFVNEQFTVSILPIAIPSTLMRRPETHNPNPIKRMKTTTESTLPERIQAAVRVENVEPVMEDCTPPSSDDEDSCAEKTSSLEKKDEQDHVKIEPEVTTDKMQLIVITSEETKNENLIVQDATSVGHCCGEENSVESTKSSNLTTPTAINGVKKNIEPVQNPPNRPLEIQHDDPMPWKDDRDIQEILQSSHAALSEAPPQLVLAYRQAVMQAPWRKYHTVLTFLQPKPQFEQFNRALERFWQQCGHLVWSRWFHVGQEDRLSVIEEHFIPVLAELHHLIRLKHLDEWAIYILAYPHPSWPRITRQCINLIDMCQSCSVDNAISYLKVQSTKWWPAVPKRWVADKRWYCDVIDLFDVIENLTPNEDQQKTLNVTAKVFADIGQKGKEFVRNGCKFPMSPVPFVARLTHENVTAATWWPFRAAPQMAWMWKDGQVVSRGTAQQSPRQ